MCTKIQRVTMNWHWRSFVLVYQPLARKQNDRLFLEALHYFTLHNISWRALPERFGNWNSIWKRFDRLGKAGVFEDYFSILAGLDESAHLIAMFDSTVIRAHISAAGAKGAGKSSARSFSWRVRNQNPSENRPKWSAPWV